MDKTIRQRKAQIWDKWECARRAKHMAKDGMGTPYPWPGYIGNHYGTTVYNGGCVRKGKWYRGEHTPLPRIVKGFNIIHVPTWGYMIYKEA